MPRLRRRVVASLAERPLPGRQLQVGVHHHGDQLVDRRPRPPAQLLPRLGRVPQQAIQRDAGGEPQVWVVNAGNVAELRPVRAGRVLANRVVIEEGLSAGEKVVVEGFQKLRPGAPVDPQPWGNGATAEMPGKDRQG